MDKGCKERAVQKRVAPKTQGHRSPSKPPPKITKKKTFMPLQECINSGGPGCCKNMLAMVGLVVAKVQTMMASPTHHP
jgi:hypothetical protein